MREGVSTRLCSSTDVVPQHSTGYMYRRTIYLSDLPRALRRTSLSEKPGSLSDPHRLRAEKPGAGIDFHLPAQQTEPGGVGGGGGKKRLLPQWLETTVKSMWLLSLVAISSGWNGAQVEEEEEGDEGGGREPCCLAVKKKKEKCLDFHKTVGFLAGECQPGLVTRSL